LARGERSSSDGERSPEERERDRQERERRRAEQRGGPPAPADPEPLPEPPVPAAEPESPPHPTPQPPLPEAEPVIEAPAEPEPEPTVPAVLPPPAEAPHEPQPALGHTPAQEPAVDYGEPVPAEPELEDAADPAPPPAEPPFLTDRTSGERPRRRGGRAGGRILAVIALLAVLAAIALVARSLKSSSAKAPPAPAVVTVLIPEGKTRAQIALIAKTAGLTGSYRLATRHSPILKPEHYGAPKSTPDLEGFLFPATYELDAHAPASRLAEEQLVAFKENFGATEFARARTLHVTPYELLIVASMIEREAAVPADRAKIAAVIYNRLKEGMPLGIDAAIYYAVELRNNVATYTGELTEADLHMNSPYNTRTHTGLPPTPISNPGNASIHAAAYPAQVPYLYYVAGADGCGEQVFSTTAAEFEANVAKYQAAVAKNGGHPPTCKK